MAWRRYQGSKIPDGRGPDGAPQEVGMTRNFLLATAALAVVGALVTVTTADARYVKSGKQEYGNAPPKELSMKDCRVIYHGQMRLVSAEAFAKYLAKHPDMKEPPPAVPDRVQSGTSGATPKRLYFVGGTWAGSCEH
jgi:hypothetical protein